MRATEEELLEEISGFLHGYLKSGKVKINSFLSKINTNISNREQLLIIRFLLKTETKEFVENLPKYLKRFKTNTVKQNDTYFGEVRGQVDWQQTMRERMLRNPKDKTIFSTNESVRSFNIPENLILKELLSILYSVLYKDSYIQGFENASWFEEWKHLKGNVMRALKNNPYLRKVDTVHVSNRILHKTLNHRNTLYRNAAKLLLSYRHLINGKYSEEDIKELLHQTLIVPDNINVLFELYWVVQIIKQNTLESELYLLDSTQNMVASWSKGTYKYKLYHDSKGDNVHFVIKTPEIYGSNNKYLEQKFKHKNNFNELASQIFGTRHSNIIWRGRPDFLIEVLDINDDLVKVYIGEVKNTENINTAILGLEELLEYIYYAKGVNGEYLQNRDIKIQGILCLGNMVQVSPGVKSNYIKVLKQNQSFNLKMD